MLYIYFFNIVILINFFIAHTPVKIHYHTGRAVPTLRAIFLSERSLNRMISILFISYTFDRVNRPSANL